MKSVALAFVSLAVTAGLAAASPDGSFDRSLSVSGPVDLEVHTDSGGISIVQGGSGVVRVHAILKAQRGWRLNLGDVESRIRELERNPPVEQSGNQVRLGFVHDRDLLKGVSIRFEVVTPSDTRVRAGADSGGITVSGLAGPVDVHTDSGGIDVRDIGSDVHATADSGGIRISNVAGSVITHVDSGGIEAYNVAGSIEAKADSGGIHLSQTKAAPIRAHVDSGGVTIHLAAGAGYDAILATSSGRLSVPEITVTGSLSSHHLEGKIRGGGPLLDVHADSGSISID
jgi:hypothetical protein